MSLLKITGGKLYDPAHGVDGEIRDLCIRDGVVIAPPVPPVRPDRILDATGLVVMPGGIDIHCHIAGAKVNAARLLQPESRTPFRPRGDDSSIRSGTQGPVPSTFTTGYLYAGLGYTTAFDAAVPPLFSRHAHAELADTPVIDKGFYTLLGNHHYVLESIAQGDHGRLRDFVGWMLNSCGSYAVKAVNPGGVEVWKQTGGNLHGMDEAVGHFNVTPRQIIRELAACVDELGLPHPLHLHCNQLGVPGNWRTTLASMQALEGRRGHITHIQFHSYAGEADDQSTFGLAVGELVEYVNSQPMLTVDVGQVLFGDTVSMTADGAVGYFLHRLNRRKWINADVELETGCGVSPITYQRKSLVHALQWAIGLEWFLRMEDPWRIALSTDHPNGASFLAYPQVIALLMEPHRRRDVMQTLPPEVREHCGLGELDRAYSLGEIAIITRAAPARMLGLKDKGHLGPGADGDVTLYQPQLDVEQMFALPRYVLKGGEVVVDDGEIRQPGNGQLLRSQPGFDADRLPEFEEWWNDRSTIRFANFPVQMDQ